MGRKPKRKHAEGVYAVLTGDIMSSRKVADRDTLQSALKAMLRDVNRAFGDIISVPFSINVGDEFQGVVVPDGRIVSLIDCVHRTLHPTRARVGVGIGAIATRFAKRSQEMDGPAFLFAREAVTQARAARPDAWLWFRTPDEEFDLAANAIALLTGLAKRRWKPLHWRRARLRDQGWSEERIAEQEGVYQGTLSLSLQNAGYGTVRRAEASLAALIDRRW